MPAPSEALIGWTASEGPLASLRCGRGPRLVFVHGFTQTATSWLPVADHFVRDFEVILVDAPGHGGSQHVRADLRSGAAMLTQLGGRATYIGYSMGGRFAMHAAIGYPSLVRGLVTLGATGGISDEFERAERRKADEALAIEIETDGVEAFLAKWLSHPLFQTLPAERQDLASRLTNTAEGLAGSLRLAGAGTQLPLWNQLKLMNSPVLAIAGSLDPKFTALAEQIVSTAPRATFRVVENAGHAAHLEQPNATATIIREWLTRQGLARP